MPSHVYLLLGYPGTGKYTVARALVDELASRGVAGKVVDNHHVNNAIFGVIQADGITPLPFGVWDLVEQVRDAVLSAIEQFAPADCTYVFTNFVRAAQASEPKVAAYVDRLRRLALSRGAELRFVTLTCETEELLRRVVEPDRGARHKWVDSTGLRTLVSKDPLYAPAGALHLDVTDLKPAAAASVIAGHDWGQ